MSGQLTGDHLQDELFKLSQRIFPDPAVTLLFRAPDDSMMDINIRRGDILVIDRSLAPYDGQVVVVNINGEWVVRQVVVHDEEAFIRSPNGSDKLVMIGSSADLVQR
jgi:DNA polymerase V